MEKDKKGSTQEKELDQKNGGGSALPRGWASWIPAAVSHPPPLVPKRKWPLDPGQGRYLIDRDSTIWPWGNACSVHQE